LSTGHKSHNIPGKFISYLEASLPVAACVNPGNDLVQIIEQEKLGFVASGPEQFAIMLSEFLDAWKVGEESGCRARSFYEEHYQPTAVAHQILASIKSIS
jgi:hypothetical protein